MYDGDCEAFRTAADISFYVEEATRRGVPTVEFACGTGRVLVPTRANSVDITGVDLSEEMAEYCRRNLDLAGLSASIHQGDMCTVDLGRTFGLATLPFRPFQHLVHIEDQLAALKNIRRHLVPGGTLIFDVFQPLFRRIVVNGPEERLDFERVSASGELIRRFSRSVSHRWRQVLDVRLRWEIQQSDGSMEHCSSEFEMRWFVEPEVRHLLARSGFGVEAVYGGFDEAPVGPESKELVFVATRV